MFRHSTAILVDGSFFLKRYRNVYRNGSTHTPELVAKNLYTQALRHVGEDNHLYRIYYYDCYPLVKRIHHPLTDEVVAFNKTEQAAFRFEFFEALKRKRKVILRLGRVKDTQQWVIRNDKTRALLQGELEISDITERDIFYDMRQKRMEIKIGLDVATLALKHKVDQIVLISGDSDVVPAARFAREEGIDFILDPMWNHIDDFLFEHIDGLRSTCPRPQQPEAGVVTTHNRNLA